MPHDLTRSTQRQAIVIQCTGNKCLAKNPGAKKLETGVEGHGHSV